MRLRRQPPLWWPTAPEPHHRVTHPAFARGGIIPGPGATPERYVTFDRHVSPHQRHDFLRELARQSCAHDGAVPVESVVDGELLAWLCPACDRQLDPGALSRE